jgi:putative exporter of polyketide antibiotics
MIEMSFWQITLRRSVRLSRTYVVLGVGMSVYGTIMSNILSLIRADSVNPSSTAIDFVNSFPVLSVAILSLSAMLSSMPVVMLFVYDKNNGVLEYLLSTGLDQLDIFKGYVKASLSLATYLLVFSNIFNTAIG